jgi:hypothetical protein
MNIKIERIDMKTYHIYFADHDEVYQATLLHDKDVSELDFTLEVKEVYWEVFLDTFGHSDFLNMYDTKYIGACFDGVVDKLIKRHGYKKFVPEVCVMLDLLPDTDKRGLLISFADFWNKKREMIDYPIEDYEIEEFLRKKSN